MERNTSYKDIALRAAAVLLVFVMLSVHMLCGLMARYTSSATDADAVAIATINVNGSGTYTSNEILFDAMAPGDTRSYDISIASDSEVAVKCSAAIETTAGLPLSCKLQQNGADVDMDSLCSFEPGTDDADFTLVVSWASTDTDIKYMDEIDAIRVIVTAVQTD